MLWGACPREFGYMAKLSLDNKFWIALLALGALLLAVAWLHGR